MKMQHLYDLHLSTSRHIQWNARVTVTIARKIIKVIVHSFSGANRLYKNAATNRIGYDMSIALVGISIPSFSAQYTTMAMPTAAVVIPQIKENHNGIIHPPILSDKRKLVAKSIIYHGG